MLAYTFYESDTRLLQYASALIERGDVVDVIALRREGQPKYEVVEGANVFRIQMRRVNERSLLTYVYRIAKFFFLAAAVLTRKHLSRPYRLVHVHSVPDFLVFTALPAKLLGARVVLDIHDILPEFFASKFNVGPSSFVFKLLLWVEKLSARAADHVIVANHLWHERLLSRSVRQGKCTPICNYPVREIFFERTRQRSNGKFVIIYPGTLNFHQGLDIAVRAFAKIEGQMPEAEFHLYGDGPTKPSLIRLAKELGVERRVLFHDFLPLRQIGEVMADSDLGVVPKRASSKFGNEAASTKILQFMALGVPLIVSRTKVDTYYHDDSMVKFFESGNVDELADCMLELRRNPQLREQLVKNGLNYAEKNNWGVRKQGYLDLVDRLASAKS